MHGMTLIVVALAVVGLIATLSSGKAKSASSAGSLVYVRRNLMTARELEFFRSLCAALPDATIHSQVAMAALVDVKGGNRASRNAFDRKIFDYVVCRPDGFVLYVVELDDRSHSGSASRKRDAVKDQIANSAGLRIVRYKSVRTNAHELLRDFNAMQALAASSAGT